MRKYFTVILVLSAVSLFGKSNISSDSIKTDSIIREPEIFDRAEVMPTFPGGPAELMKFMSKNINYPSLARENGLQGKVVVKFYIDVDGSVKEPVVLKDGVGGGCAEEAVRVVSIMPKWNPGSQRNKPVKVYYVLPITFKLNDDIAPVDKPVTSNIEPAYPGGDVQLEFYKQELIAKLKKPKNEKKERTQVLLSFTIDDLGKVNDPVILSSNTKSKKNIEILLDGIKNMTNWYPAMENGKTIIVRKTILFEY